MEARVNSDTNSSTTSRFRLYFGLNLMPFGQEPTLTENSRLGPHAVRMTRERSAPMPPHGGDEPFPCRTFTPLCHLGMSRGQSSLCVMAKVVRMGLDRV
jgi:hypothetical protein